MSFEKYLEEHERRTQWALRMGGAERVAKQRSLGRLNARERIDYLCDPGSFLEAGRFATAERPETREETPADGKVCGYGRIDGREAAIVSHDITVKSASSSPINRFVEPDQRQENGAHAAHRGGKRNSAGAAQ
jgi:acetyl-CoA carboxylase carboxyltransferase component